ncbi:MAG: hypothetical protein BWY62_01162 [Firmicutes bacterium ADurb.Bin356]|nr:MAG: hypothetical protein BWY62_01162 [Firmicutes bacterium ADurb.Bin356]
MGLSPTTPQREAGCLIEPPESEPSEHIAMPAATAAAGPPLEPPGTLSRSQGFFTGPKYEFSFDEPIANSSMFAFPARIYPAALSLSMTVAS